MGIHCGMMSRPPSRTAHSFGVNQQDLACTRSASCCRRCLTSSGAELHAPSQNASSRPTAWNPTVWPSLPCCADALTASEAAAESCGGCPQAPPSSTCTTCRSNATTPRCSRTFEGLRSAMRHCSSAREQAPEGSMQRRGDDFVTVACLQICCHIHLSCLFTE